MAFMNGRGRSRIAGAVLAAALIAPSSLAYAADAAPKSDLTKVDSHEGQRLIAVTSIPYKTVIVDDDTLPDGVEVEMKAGADGQMNIFAALADSVLKLPELFPETVLKPTDRVIHRGTKIDVPTATAPAPKEEPKSDPAAASRSESDSAGGSPGSVGSTEGIYTLDQFMFLGRIEWGGQSWTWYSQGKLPGGGLSIPGRHVNADGFVADSDGYIALASPYAGDSGSIYATPFGYTGKVYDVCADGCSSIDVYIR